MTQTIRILGIAGSLRRASFNRAALRAAVELVPDGATLETFELDGIPGFNQDDERTPPERVVALGARRAEERDRLGLAAVRGQRVGEEAGGGDGSLGRSVRHGARSTTCGRRSCSWTCTR